MPRPRRTQFEGAFCHVYNRGVDRRAVAFDDEDRRAFFHLLGEAVEEFRMRLFAYCLMDNHFHLFLQMLRANLGKFMQAFEGRYAHHINLRHERVGALFQGRYKSRLVQAEAYGLVLARYIHRNPVEAGSVAKVQDYPWSSYGCYTGELPRWSWLDTKWLLNQMDPDPQRSPQLFMAFHRVPIPEAERKMLERWGRPLRNPQGGQTPSGLEGSDPEKTGV